MSEVTESMGEFPFLGEVSEEAIPDKQNVGLDIGNSTLTFKIQGQK